MQRAGFCGEAELGVREDAIVLMAPNNSDPDNLTWDMSRNKTGWKKLAGVRVVLNAPLVTFRY